MANKKLPMLTAHGQQIVQLLARAPRQRITSAALAEALGVSRRTVLRELAGVEQWMAAAGFALQNVPGQGLMLDESAARCEELLRLLDGGTAVLSKNERRVALLTELLAAKEPVKIAALAQEIEVSTGTLTADLDNVAEWLASYHVQLCRKPGVGVWLDGEPSALRRACEALVRADMPMQELQAILQRQPSAGQSKLAALLDPPTAALVWGILTRMDEEEGLHFSDTGLISLALHLTLAIQQQNAGKIPYLPAEIEHGAGSEQALRLTQRLEDAFSIELPPQEVNYLSGCIAAYCKLSNADELVTAQDMNLRNLAALLIAEVGRTMQVDLSRWPSLADDLSAHLKPMLHRVKEGAIAENPQLELIETQYHELWCATRAACDTASRTLGLPYIPDAEAGFIAMHFGAVLEQDSMAKMRLCAVVVCPYGMSTSKFLASQLIRDFPVLHIQASCSIRELEPERLRAQGVDIVISTVPLELAFPWLCISPILKESDKARLRDLIARVRQAPVTKPAESVREAEPESELRHTQELTASMLELLDTLTVRAVDIPKSRESLIHTAAALFCTDKQKRQLVEDTLLRRETLGDTYIKPLQALLLHCRTKAVSGCRLGYLQAQPPVYEDGKFIRGALVLLAPDNESSVPREVMSSVSALLIENPQLMEALRGRNLRLASHILEEGLSRQFTQQPYASL